MLKKRKTGKFFVRNRDSDSDTPFDDEGESYSNKIGPTDIDAMTLDTFNARYLSQTSPEFRKYSDRDAQDRWKNAVGLKHLKDNPHEALLNGTGLSENIMFSPIAAHSTKYM